MITESLLNTMLHELSTVEHLYTKLHPENANWRPAENIRSTMELLQYLAGIGASQVVHFVDPLEDKKEGAARYFESRTRLGQIAFEDFPAAIAREKEAIRTALEKISDRDLTRTTYQPWSGQELSLYDALSFSARVLSAYRNQLFLYAKMNGANINTMNNWAGVDAAMPAAAAAV